MDGEMIKTALMFGGGEGSAPSPSSIKVGTLTDSSTAFPTTRPDGTALHDEDWVVYIGNATIEEPKVIAGISFVKSGQKAFYSISTHTWFLDAGVITNTREVVVSSPELESLEGTAQSQYGVNKQLVRKIGTTALANELNGKTISEALNYLNTEYKKAGFTFTLTETDNDSNRSFVVIITDKDNNTLLTKTLSTFLLNTRTIAGIDLVDNITAQELEDALKAIEVEYSNKTIDADNNEIKNIETDNLKNSALAKSTDTVRTYDNSVDTKITTEKFLQKTLKNISTPENNNDAVNKKYVDDELQKVIDNTFTFKGFVSTTEPTDNIINGAFWYNSSSLPTTFPINVKTYNANTSTWSSDTTEYTPKTFDTWSLVSTDVGYYWFGNKWKAIEIQAMLDDTSIAYNNRGEIEVKDAGITKSKLNSNVVDNSTLGLDNTNGLQVKDNGITNDKLATDVKVGSLAELTTTDKTSVVGAINELKASPSGITDVVQTSNPTDSDSLSDLSGTTNKRWTFSYIWNWVISKISSSCEKGIQVSSGKLGHSNNITANTTNGIKTLAVDAQGHITSYTAKTLGRGISDSSNAIGHSNSSITEATTQAFYPTKIDAYGHITAYGTGQSVTDVYASAANNQLLNRNGANNLWKNCTKLVGIFNRSSSQTVSFNAWGNISLTTTDTGSTNTSYCSLSSNGIKFAKAGTYRFEITIRLTDSVSSETFVGWSIGCTGEQDTENGGGWFQTKNRHKVTTSIIHYCAANTVIYPCVYILNGINTVNYCKVEVYCIKEV